MPSERTVSVGRLVGPPAEQAGAGLYAIEYYHITALS